MPGGFGDDNDAGGRYDNFGGVNPSDPSVANGQITPAQWADYQAKRKKDFILGMLGVLGATTGLGAAGMAMNGAGAAGAASVPGAVSGAPITAASQGAAFGVPTVTAGGGAGAAGAGLAGAGASIPPAVTPPAKGVGAGMTARDWMALAAGGAGTLGGALSKPPDLKPNTGTDDPQLRELLNLMMGRLKKSEPLHDSVLSMANGLLPTQYQNGGRGNG